MFEIVFSFYVKDSNLYPCLHNIRLSYNKKYIEMLQCFVNQNGHVYINSKHGSFFVKSYENTFPKGRALMQMYRVVPITKEDCMVQ